MKALSVLLREWRRLLTPPAVAALSLVLAGLLLAMGGCQTAEQEPASHSAVSPVPIETGEPLRTEEPAPRVEIYYGKGDCAPRLPNGMLGTCINDQPCNGFGFKDEKGGWQCACFAKVGGCAENEACSFRKRNCVRIDEADFLRPPSN